MKLTSSIPIIPQAALQPCSFPCLLVPFPRVRSLAFIILNIFTYLLIVSDLPTPLAFSPLCHVCTLPQHTLGPRALAGRSWGTGSLAVDFLTLTLKTAEVEREKQPSLLHKILNSICPSYLLLCEKKKKKGATLKVSCLKFEQCSLAHRSAV